MDKFKEVAVSAAKKSGNLLKEKFVEFDRANVQLKSTHEILTENDLLSEKIILQEIEKSFPDHAIFSEEAGRKNKDSDYLWIIDPLDGTTNFSIHNPIWSVSIALSFKGEIVLGVVYSPVLDEIFVAEKGNGSTRNGEPIRVSEVCEGKIINTFCHGGREEDIKRAIAYYCKEKLKNFDCRQMGSAALELAYVASGRIESIAIPGANAYDVAAGVILVRESGGKVTDFSDKEWGLTSPDILATNGKVHNLLLKDLKEI